MTVTRFIITLVLLLAGPAACADDSPVRATYVPADCPPCEGAETVSGSDADPAVIEIAPEEVDELGPDEGDEQVPASDLSLESASESEAPNADVAGDPININTAGELELIDLPGVGPALAGRIVEYRDKRSFKAPDELLRVRGIGPAKFAEIEPLITTD